jgi:hypothetical protein
MIFIRGVNAKMIAKRRRQRVGHSIKKSLKNLPNGPWFLSLALRWCPGALAFVAIVITRRVAW